MDPTLGQEDEEHEGAWKLKTQCEMNISRKGEVEDSANFQEERRSEKGKTTISFRKMENVEENF